MTARNLRIKISTYEKFIVTVDFVSGSYSNLRSNY